jgi:hypothetical protein
MPVTSDVIMKAVSSSGRLLTGITELISSGVKMEVPLRISEINLTN